MCNCATLPPCVVSESHHHGALIGPRDLLETSDEAWAELHHCRDCGQHWFLEAVPAHGRGANMAFKVPSREGWTRWDRRPALAEHLILKQGGLSHAMCLWAGCPERAMKDMYVCVRHGHSEYRW